jgi:hypothetical protein
LAASAVVKMSANVSASVLMKSSCERMPLGIAGSKSRRSPGGGGKEPGLLMI